MASASVHVPAYCHHKSRDQAYVRFGAEMIYLGKYDSPESREKYDRITAEWMLAGRTFVKSADQAIISVNEILLAYRRHAEQTYVDVDGKPTSEVERVNLAFRPVMDLYGTTPAEQFGPRSLVVVQDKMVVSGLCRRTINQRMGVIKRAFRWAVSQELVAPSVYHGLLAVEGLRRGRSKATESKPVKAVSDQVINTVLTYLPPSLQAMVKLHSLTGARSGELCIMRGIDIETTTDGNPWVYRPTKHKTQNHGHERTIFIGPEAQEVLRPYLKADVQGFIFSPAQARMERDAAKRANRKSKVQPSQINRKKPKPKKKPGDRWNPAAYRRALEYATKLAIKHGDLPEGTHWFPHQIRHAAATRIRKRFGLDAVRAVLGHRTVVQSAEYAELDANLAFRTVAAVG